MSQTVRPDAPVKSSKSKAPWFIWLAIVFAAVAWWLLYQSKYFLVEQVTVVGNARLSSEQITGAAAVPVGNSLMSINTGIITEQLSALPEIKVVAVERGWPNSILISVTERNPIAVAQTAAGFNLIDDEGVNAGVVAAPRAGLLVIAAEPDSVAMKNAIAVLAAAPAEWPQ